MATPSETIHASCVVIGGRGVLLAGPSGSGKSDLALRLVDRGAQLVSDDYSDLRAAGGVLVARPRATIAGRLEVRGIGIVKLPHQPSAPIALLIALDGEVERMPADPLPRRPLAGIAIPTIALDAFEPSAPIKVELALALFGLSR